MNTLNVHTHRIHGPKVQQDQQFVFSGTPGTWLSTAVIYFMAVTLLALFLFPVARALAYVEVSYNEGWNAYKQAMAANGIPLYGTPPGHFNGSPGYPPFSFHFIGWLGHIGSFTAAGRWVSLVSLIVTGIFVALIVRHGGGTPQTALFSFLLYEIGILILLPDRAGMNDPQLLGEVFSAAGLYSYIRYRGSGSNRLLYVSALAFCVAGFTKQTLIAFPVAVAIDLLLRSHKAAATWAGTLFLSAGLLTALTVLIDGPYFFVHLTVPRAYLYRVGWSNIHHYLLTFQGLLVLGTAWSICAFRSRIVFASAFFLGHLFAFLLAGGDGVDFNIFFTALAATVIVCGIALADVTFALKRLPAMPNPGASAALMFALFTGLLIQVPGQLRRDFEENQVLHSYENQFRSAVQLVKTRPAPALCESLLLCYEAGKPYEFDAFFLRDQLRTGRLHEDEVLQLLRARYFQTVQIMLLPVEEENPKSELIIGERPRFTANFMNELVEHYQLSKRTSKMAIFIPK